MPETGRPERSKTLFGQAPSIPPRAPLEGPLMSMPAPPADPNGGQPPAAPAAPPAPAPAPAPTPAAPPAPAPQAQPPAPPAVPQPPTWTPPQPPAVDDGGIDDISKLPKKWQKELTDARGDAAKYRVQARAETVLRHAYTTAAAHGVNPAALLGSTAFASVASALDPNAEDFPAKLADAIKGALTANPWMAAAAATPPPPPTPGVSGGEFTGAPGGTTPITETQLASMTPEQIAKALEEGKLNHLL